MKETFFGIVPERIRKALCAFLVLALVFPFPLITQAQEVESTPPQSSIETPTPQAETSTEPQLEEAPAEEANQTPEPPTGSEEQQLPVDEEPSVEETDVAPEELEEGELSPEMEMLMSGDDEASTIAKDEYSSRRYAQVDDLTGSLKFEIPIETPPGRLGIEPNLYLRYSSQPQSETSVVGYGWSLSIPYIERINRRGTEKMFSDTYFNSTLSGELASTSATTYKAKVERGDFTTYEFSGNMWTATDTEGKVYKFGHATSTRQDHQNNPATTTKWMLEEIRDTNDNYIKFEYYKDSGQIYPSRISYTHTASSTNGIFEVELNREARSDVGTSSAVGFPIYTAERISEIVTKVNGTWVRKYELNYADPVNRSRSLLASITEHGRDDAGATTTLPAHEFDYQESEPAGWNVRSEWVPQPYIAAYNGVPYGTLTADVNGDGRPDLLHSYYHTNPNPDLDEETVYLNTGSGWATSTQWTYPWSGSFVYNNVGQPFFVVDVNADGFDDVIYCGTVANDCQVYTSNGSAFATSTANWPIPVPFIGGNGYVDTWVVDINGDQLPDLLKSDNQGFISSVYINNGAGWTSNSSWVLSSPPGNDGGDLGTAFLDLNGDGLLDLVRSYGNLNPDPNIHFNAVYLNTGTGWATSTNWTHPMDYEISRAGRDMGFRFADVNGDNLTDIVQYHGDDETEFWRNVFINTGSGWVNIDDEIESEWAVPYAFTTVLGKDPGVRMLDIDGNGLPDHLISQQGSSGFTKQASFSDAKKVDVLTAIQYPQGGTTQVGYKTSHEYKDGATFLNTTLPYPVLAVASTTHNSGFGDQSKSTYTYEGGKLYTNGPYDRKFAGFNLVTKTDPAGNVTKTYFHQGSTTESSLGEYDDHISKIGRAYRTEQYDSSSNKYAVTISKWDKVSLGGERNFIKLIQKLDLAYDADPVHKDRATSYAYDNATGNLIQKIDWGEVIGSNDGTFSDTGSDLASTTITYAASSTLIGLPATELTHNQSLTKIQETRHYYDNLSLGSVTKGNETKREEWIAGSTYASTTKVYDSTGVAASQRDANGNLTTYTLDSAKLYPATTTNALGHATGYIYDYSSGKIKQTYDPNDRLHARLYDGLDRLVANLEPDPVTGAPATTTAYAYTVSATPGNTSIEETSYLNTSTSTKRYTYFDGFNRKLQERSQAEIANTYMVRDWAYDTRALLASETLPYFDSGSARTAAASSSALYTNYTYDPLGRIANTTNAAGNTANYYAQWLIQKFDPKGKVTYFAKDARNNLRVVYEVNSGNTYLTIYEWDPNGNLTKITDAMGNIRTFAYDGLNRRTTATDLHATADNSYGTTTYTYDVAGNLTQKVDGKGQVIQYAYDALNRQLSENYTGAAGTEISYAYDSCQDGVGRLCVATSTGAVATYSYGPSGLTASERQLIDSTSYVTSYAYDRRGNIIDLTYPDGSIVKYGYDDAGFLDTVSRKAASSSTYALAVTELQYAPTGAVSLVRLGNGVTTTNTFDAASLYRLINILTVASTTVLGGGGSGGMLGLMSGGGEGGGESMRMASGPDLLVDGESLALNSTDDNTGEDLIISTDSFTYSGISQADVYFAIDNISESAQDVGVNFFFPEDEYVSGIERLSTATYQVPVMGERCAELPATSTAKVVKGKQRGEISCDSVPTGQSTSLTIAGPSKSLVMSAGEDAAAAQKLQTAGKERKSVDGYSGGNTFKDTLLPGEKAYYKAVMRFSGGSSGKFFIEAIGSKGAYGHLDPWFSSNWQFRKKITINAAANAGTGYQVFLKIGETSGASGEDFDLGGHSAVFPSAKDQGGDLRFTASDQSTELKFWVEHVKGTTPNRLAYVWVKVDADLGSTTDIYAYYGNAGASNSSNGFNTFSFYDDFNDGVINGQKWSTYCASGCNQIGGASATVSETGGNLLQLDAAVAGSNSRLMATTTPINTSGYALKRRFSRLDNGTYGNSVVGFGSDTATLFAGTTTPSIVSRNFQNRVETETVGTTSILYNTDLTQNAWYREEARRVSSTTVGGGLWTDAQTLLASNDFSTTSPIATTEYPYMRSADGHDVRTDWILLRKYVATEPGYSSAASEEVIISAASNIIQNISYAYDPVGNIVAITDNSGTKASKGVAFTYDDLHRLTSASTTYATSTPYKEMYSYDILGNLTFKTGVGSSTYAGTGYANPHAATVIGSTTFSYDNNGNVTAAGSAYYAWDYANRLASAGNGSATTTFAYDHASNRTKKVSAGVTTHYPNKYSYRVGSATTTDYIYIGDTVIAEVESVNGAATTTRYAHLDHLGSTNDMTDYRGAVLQTLDYYPFGASRISQVNDTSTERRQFIGQFNDPETNLAYLNARYYNGTQGKFLSQDPVFWEIGQTPDGKAALSNPQLQNSYSYAGNNPITQKDPSGRFIPQAIALGGLYGGFAGFALQAYSDYRSQSFGGLGAYAGATSRGAITGAATVVSPLLGGGAAGGSSLLGTYWNKGNITYEDVINASAEGAVAGFTAGFVKGLPGVRGVQATKVFGGNYFTGAHGTRYAQEGAFGFGTDVFYEEMRDTADQFLTPNANTRLNYQMSGFSSSQSRSLSFVQNAFKPNNSAQSKAIKNLFKAFGIK